jgi:hypothetical protein
VVGITVIRPPHAITLVKVEILVPNITGQRDGHVNHLAISAFSVEEGRESGVRHLVPINVESVQRDRVGWLLVATAAFAPHLERPGGNQDHRHPASVGDALGRRDVYGPWLQRQ